MTNKKILERNSLTKRISIFIIFLKKFFPGIREIKRERLSFCGAILSGILFILIFPKPSLSFLAWVTLVPFLLSIKGKSPKISFWLGLVFGFIGFYGSLFWVNWIRKYNPIAVFGIPFLCLYLACYPALFALAVSYLEKYLKRFHFLFSATLWTSLEYLRSLGQLAFPWNYLSASQVDSTRLIQICDFSGVFGVSFLIVLTNQFLADMIFYFKKKDYRKIPLEIAILSGCLVLTFVYGTFRLKEKFDEGTYKIKIGVVQPSIPQDIKLKSYSDPDQSVQKKLQEGIAQKLFSMIQREKGKGIDLFILPETAFTDQCFDINFELHKTLESIAREVEADFFFGADRLVMLNKDGEITNDKNEFVGLGAYNSAWFLSKTGGLNLNSYDKIHLLAFGEYLPYFDKIPFFQEMIVQIGSFLKGEKIAIFESKNIKFGGGICFESVFGELMRRFRIAGADFLTIITNDGWYEETAGPLQHTDFCVFRAIENRCWLVRCGNNGISGFISPHGIWTSKSKINEVGVLIDEINIDKNVRSFYSRYGDVFAQILLLLTFLTILKFLLPPLILRKTHTTHKS